MMTNRLLNLTELASMGGKARAAKLTPEEQSRIGRKAVRAREANRALANAHLPTWIKVPLMELRSGTSKSSYRHLGRKIGGNIDDYVEDFDNRFTDEEWNKVACWDACQDCYFVREGVRPTPILRRILASERHPNAYNDLVRHIPTDHRPDFLAGIIDGLAEDRYD